jgi:hypothetical protein
MSKKKRLTWNDLRDGKSVSEHYGMSTRDTERELQRHLKGASTSEKRQMYQQYFGKKV